MWSDLLAENTSRAAALRTDCSRRNNVPDTPTSTVCISRRLSIMRSISCLTSLFFATTDAYRR